MVASDERLGELTGRMQGVERRLDKLEKSVDDGNDMTREILLKFSEVRGGWKVLMAVGAVAAAIGGGIVKFVPMLWGR